MTLEMLVSPNPRVECGWCGCRIKDGNLPVSHGMCEECFKLVLAEKPTPLMLTSALNESA